MPLFDRIRSNDGQPVFLLDVDVEQRDDAVASLRRYQFLVRYSDQPEAAQALEWLTNRWDKLDDDLQRWLRENQPHLVPDSLAESDVP